MQNINKNTKIYIHNLIQTYHDFKTKTYTENIDIILNPSRDMLPIKTALVPKSAICREKVARNK